MAQKNVTRDDEENDAKKGYKRGAEFFEDLTPDGADSSTLTTSKRPRKEQKPVIQVPAWGKGSGKNLQKYVKNKELFDIESMIQKYIKDNNIEVIDAKVAERKFSEYKNSEKLLIKTSELQRIERLKNNEDMDKKTDEDRELQDYFIKDSLTINEIRTFESMHLNEKLMKSIRGLNYTTPTPIQSAAIPVALSGKDVCGCAATGTGKTAAYLLPTLDRLLCAGRRSTPVTRVVIIVPTRELGVQVYQVSQSLTKNTRLTVALVCGGLNVKMQEKEVLAKPDIIIATPGRLMGFKKYLKGFTLEHVEILVLDEADRILDEYFMEQMQDVINGCSQHRQTLLFSATMTTEVKKVAVAALNEPVKLFVNSNVDVAQGLRQEYILLKEDDQDTRLATLAFLLINVFNNNTVAFLPTKILCHRVYVMLRLMGVTAAELHSKMPQSARLQNMALFSSGQVRVLLATDLAARGLDIPGVDTVINYQLNSSYEMYVHRVGRTARAGKQGLAVSLVPDKQYSMLKIIKKSSKTMMYERKVPQKHIDLWKDKTKMLQEMCSAILEIEREAVNEAAEHIIQKRMNNLKFKQGKSNKLSDDKNIRKLKTGRNGVAGRAKEEGMNTKDFLRMKSLTSNKVSNSKKKRMIRFKERNDGNDAAPGKQQWALKKRVFQNPSIYLYKK